MLTPLEALLATSRFEGAQQRYKESVGKLNRLNVAHLSSELQAERQTLIESGQKVLPMLEPANVIVASYRLAQDKRLSDQHAETLKTATDALNTYVTNVNRVVRLASSATYPSVVESNKSSFLRQPPTLLEPEIIIRTAPQKDSDLVS